MRAGDGIGDVFRATRRVVNALRFPITFKLVQFALQDRAVDQRKAAFVKAIAKILVGRWILVDRDFLHTDAKRPENLLKVRCPIPIRIDLSNVQAVTVDELGNEVFHFAKEDFTLRAWLYR